MACKLVICRGRALCAQHGKAGAGQSVVSDRHDVASQARGRTNVNLGDGHGGGAECGPQEGDVGNLVAGNLLSVLLHQADYHQMMPV